MEQRDSIDHVQITVAETVGVDGRWPYYDDYGALRDMVQNHMLQLLCLVAMEPPANLEPDSVRNEKVKVLRSLRPIGRARGREADGARPVRAGVVDGKTVPGYSRGDGRRRQRHRDLRRPRRPISTTGAGPGVPFYLRTGKRLADRATQIVIQFRDVPHSIFSRRRTWWPTG